MDEMIAFGLEHHRKLKASAGPLDNKAVAVGVTATAVAGLLITNADTIPIWEVVLLLSLLPLIASVVCVLQVLRIRNFTEEASAETLLDKYWDASPDEIKYAVLYYAGQAEAHNENLLDSKHRWLGGAIGATTLGVSVLVLGLLIFEVLGGDQVPSQGCAYPGQDVAAAVKAGAWVLSEV